MANEDSALLREVDQELAEERQWRMFRQYGPAVLAGAAAIVIGVAAWQAWSHIKTQKSEKEAIAYAEAMKSVETDPTAGRTALSEVAAENTGYAVLARLQLAASYAKGGERLKALEIYREIIKGDAPKRVRQLAQLRAAHLALPDGRDVVLADLGDLVTEQGRYGFYAREVEALASLYAKDYEASLSTFRELSIATDAPEGVRRRAEEFAALASAGKAGVNITGELRVEDLLKAVGEETAADENAAPAGAGEASEDAAAPEAPDDENGDHADHDHAE
ncbi:MAG: tetratricopeptide repeat protein [Parvularculaceae bacterium]